jgi:hypothetical protein
VRVVGILLVGSLLSVVRSFLVARLWLKLRLHKTEVIRLGHLDHSFAGGVGVISDHSNSNLSI